MQPFSLRAPPGSMSSPAPPAVGLGAQARAVALLKGWAPLSEQQELEAVSLGKLCCAGGQLGSIVPSTEHGLP